jgi:hypothetical protein
MSDLMLSWLLGRANAKQPQLTAPVRAGAEVNTFWTAITRMHNGPALAYLAPNPGPDTKATDLKFFKIYEAGFIPSAGEMLGFDGCMMR